LQFMGANMEVAVLVMAGAMIPGDARITFFR
jgi:hypothetical protein